MKYVGIDNLGLDKAFNDTMVKVGDVEDYRKRS